MGRMNIYTVLSGNEANWSVVKMDRDWNQEDTYHVSKHVNVCSCFAGNKTTCRHRELVEVFKRANAVDSRRAYDFDKDKWIDPPKAHLEMLT